MALYKRRLPDGSRSPTWHYDFRIRGRRYKGCTSQREKQKAREFEDELKAEVRLGRPLNGPAPTILPTVKEYAEAYLTGDGALKRSVDDDRSILDRALIPVFGRKRLDEITRADVEAFRNQRREGKVSAEGHERKRKGAPSPQTVKLELALLRRILNIAVEADLLDRNPAKGVRMPHFSNRRDRVIDSEEYARLLLAASTRQGPHMRTVITLGWETGMREGEILSLRWSDVDLVRHFVRLVQTKTGEPRKVPLTEAAERALREWRRRDSVYVFPAPGREGHIGLVSRAFSRIAGRASVEGVRFHDLRHTFCTRHVEGGADLIKLADITGHKTLAMLRRYSHPSDESKLALVRGLEGSPQSHPTDVSGRNRR